MKTSELKVGFMYHLGNKAIGIYVGSIEFRRGIFKQKKVNIYRFRPVAQGDYIIDDDGLIGFVAPKNTLPITLFNPEK